jgi:hypothetical protein
MKNKDKYANNPEAWKEYVTEVKKIIRNDLKIIGVFVISWSLCGMSQPTYRIVAKNTL